MAPGVVGLASTATSQKAPATRALPMQLSVEIMNSPALAPLNAVVSAPESALPVLVIR